MTPKPKTAEQVDFTPPGHLSDRSQRLWADKVPRKARSAGRLAMIQTALEALDRADEVRVTVGAEGLTTRTETTGAVHAHPLLKIERECRAQFAKLWDSMGFAWESEIDGVSNSAIERMMLARQAPELDEEDEDENDDE